MAPELQARLTRQHERRVDAPRPSKQVVGDADALVAGPIQHQRLAQTEIPERSQRHGDHQSRCQPCQHRIHPRAMEVARKEQQHGADGEDQAESDQQYRRHRVARMDAQHGAFLEPVTDQQSVPP